MSDREILKRLAPLGELPDKLARLYGMVRSSVRLLEEAESDESLGKDEMDRRREWVAAAILAYARVAKALNQNGTQWMLDFLDQSKALIGRQVMPIESEEGDLSFGASKILESLYPIASEKRFDLRRVPPIEYLSVFADTRELQPLETEAATRFF